MFFLPLPGFQLSEGFWVAIRSRNQQIDMEYRNSMEYRSMYVILFLQTHGFPYLCEVYVHIYLYLSISVSIYDSIFICNYMHTMIQLRNCLPVASHAWAWTPKTLCFMFPEKPWPPNREAEYNVAIWPYGLRISHGLKFWPLAIWPLYCETQFSIWECLKNRLYHRLTIFTI